MEQVLENSKKVEQEISSFLSCDEQTAEQIMIENAAVSLEKIVLKECGKKQKSVLIMCGSGNNGADGYTLCRHLAGQCKVFVLKCFEPKSFFCKAAFENAKPLLKENENLFALDENPANSKVNKVIKKSDVIVDCIFGTGFHGLVDSKIQNLFKIVNCAGAVKIACDIPSGIDLTSENISAFSVQEKKQYVFFADKTVSMGAHKISLFSDNAKDAVGKIVCANIGVSKKVFLEAASKVFPSDRIFLLKKSDARLPFRSECNTHKGTFGHTCVIAGEKKGAAILCALSALRCGSGLSSIADSMTESKNDFQIPACIMTSSSVPENSTCIVIGSGFGRENNKIDEFLSVLREKDTAVLFDADSFYYKQTVDFLLENENKKGHKIVLTPHPKEFSSLLKLAGLGDFSVQQITDRRVELVRTFCRKFKNCVLVLKGANTFIGYGDSIYISVRAKPCLSKGGSGDVLAGVIAGLLAQGYDVLDAAVTGVLMHAAASRKFKKSYNLVPEDLILKL
ncbi:MAG: NAD(P)H-hydrate dehydratase [Treponema sp.]